MKKNYNSPQADILRLSMEQGACVTASAAENEGFDPIPGIWDNDKPALPNFPMM